MQVLDYLLGKKKNKKKDKLGIIHRKENQEQKIGQILSKNEFGTSCNMRKQTKKRALYQRKLQHRFCTSIRQRHNVKKKSNMDIKNVGKRKYVPKAYAIKDVNPNQEIYYYYSPQYWN